MNISLKEKAHSHKTTRVGQGWCMPRQILRFGDQLMQQQLWCWGRDVERAEGNLLMEFGFERHRDCAIDPQSTCYRLDCDELHVSLWGFGMFFGRRDLGGLYINRFDFRPRWAPIESLAEGIHWPQELPAFARPRGRAQWVRARDLWSGLLRWIADYEAWVQDTSEPTYRSKTVETWLRPFVRAEKMSAAWQFLSNQDWNGQSKPLSELLKRYKLSRGAK
ncbi:MAG: hypothetical protein MK329_17250 [Pirellulales bacterium]|nr:hypothetical protein [Pirellulales bacterium]